MSRMKPKLNEILVRFIHEELKKQLNESDNSRYTMITKKAKDTDVYPANGDDIVYCFKVDYNDKDIFNTITSRYPAARDYKHRFHWSKKLRMWCTRSEKSMKEAKEILSYGKSAPKTTIRNNDTSAIDSQFETIIVTGDDYNKETKTFSFEASDKQCNIPSTFVYLQSAKTKTKIKFKFVKYDTDGEDIYGANYISVNKDADGDNYKLLIIND